MADDRGQLAAALVRVLDPTTAINWSLGDVINTRRARAEDLAANLTDALLPVVDRIARKRAAEELRAAADEFATVPGNPYPLVVGEHLRDRADALDAEAGPSAG